MTHKKYTTAQLLLALLGLPLMPKVNVPLVGPECQSTRRLRKENRWLARPLCTGRRLTKKQRDLRYA